MFFRAAIGRMTQRGIRVVGLLFLVSAAGCGLRACGSAPPSVSVPAPTPATPTPEPAPAPANREHELWIRTEGPHTVITLRDVGIPTALGEWRTSVPPTAAELAPVARAVPHNPDPRQVTLRAADGVPYAIIIAVMDACHEDGITHLLVGPPPAPR